MRLSWDGEHTPKAGSLQRSITTKKAKFSIRELFENEVVLPKLVKFKEMNCCHEPVKGKVPSSTP
jgi:hypothetical protein